MSATAAGLAQIGILFTALAAVWRPLGDHMARTFTSTRHLRVERMLYKGMGVDPGAEQRWPVYITSVLAFSLVSILALYALQRLQQHLWLSIGMAPVDEDQAWNTAVSFVTNTNWQSYSGESAMSHLTQMAGLAVQNFVSAAAGIAVAIAVIRGLIRTTTDELGNFWVDLVRGTVRILLPIAFAGALILVANGVVQNLMGSTEVHTLTGGTQSIPGGPVASQEVIKELGTNGGGFFNANSAHPFEGPNAFASLFQVFLLLLIPVSLTRTYGTMTGSTRQGLAILGAMATVYLLVLAGTTAAEVQGDGVAAQAAGGVMEGKETRFGVWLSALFAVSTTGTSTGAVNAFHDSFTPFGGGLVLFHMMLGEVTPGGVGSGLYGMLVLAMLAVFLGGLMVGRTPEYLGKKLRSREIRLIAMYILTTPSLVLIGSGLAIALPETRESMANVGPHGLSEIMYAFTSASGNNGSAFAGLSADTYFYNTALGVCMLFGRLLPIIFVLALAGSLARQRPVPASEGTLPTHKPLFAGMLVATVLIVTGLTFFPSLALGPLAEGLS